MFQSPRSGQICSNATKARIETLLDVDIGFNPLDRVKFVQIALGDGVKVHYKDEFQSPRSGQICSNAFEAINEMNVDMNVSIP